jgi:hypothetical protein
MTKMSDAARANLSRLRKGKPKTQGFKDKCRKRMLGKGNHRYKRGSKNNQGYIMVTDPDGRTIGGYVAQHRLIVEKVLGRVLRKEEIVHHVNHDRGCNCVKNLMVFTSHNAHHQFERGTLRDSTQVLFDGRFFVSDGEGI